MLVFFKYSLIVPASWEPVIELVAKQALGLATAAGGNASDFTANLAKAIQRANKQYPSPAIIDYLVMTCNWDSATNEFVGELSTPVLKTLRRVLEQAKKAALGPCQILF